MKKNKLIIFLFCLPLFSIAQEQSLDLKEIMKGSDFIGHWPKNPYWSFDNKTIYFQWNPENKPVDDWYAVDLNSQKYHKLDSVELNNRAARDYEYNGDRTQVCYTKDGNIFLYDIKLKKETQICYTTSYESSPRFNKKGTKIIYQKDKNLYTWNIKTGHIIQLTNIVNSKGKKSSWEKPSEQEKWLKDDRKELFDVFKLQDERQKARTNNQKLIAHKSIQSINIGSAQIFGLQVSPNERYVSFIKMLRAKAKKTEVPNYVTRSGYIENEKARAKVGSQQSTFTLVFFDRETNKSYELKTSKIPGIKEWPKPYTDKKTGERKLTFSDLKYSPDGTKALLICRSQDNKDRWILTVNPANGEPKLINQQTDEAWIGGPGIGSYWPTGNFGWMPDSKSIWYQSEKTGYSHLYVSNIKSKKEKALTKGKFEVHEVQMSNDKTQWYLLTNQVHPGQRQLYSMPLKGGELTKITNQVGTYQIFLSPDQKHIATLFSNSYTPWEIYLKENTPQAKETQITHSQSKKFKAYPWRKTEIFTFKASDNADVYARIYQPKEGTKNNAAVIFVHGAGYLQNVGEFWSYYYREMMFHNLLADKGYTVLDIDYRGSEGYGRDWRTGIYRHMGGKDLSDQVDAATMLVKKYGIDKNRIGIYGGSYGGFITLMAMFTAPNVFKCGAGIRSVTNWSNYNHGYTSNILNTPVSDPEAYHQSSPIYFADGLKGHLLILHGMRDDNVHFQDVVDLNQRLIELGKTNWEMAVFPLERHGFIESSSWADEYRRIFELFEKELKQ